MHQLSMRYRHHLPGLTHMQVSMALLPPTCMSVLALLEVRMLAVTVLRVHDKHGNILVKLGNVVILDADQSAENKKLQKPHDSSKIVAHPS